MKAKFFLWGQRLIERGPWYLGILAPLSWLWALFTICKNKFYDGNWLPISRVNCTVVSVGNIVAGGTGKTPLVHLLAKTFSHRNVAILSRGYGEMPDEPALLARRLPKANIYVGKDRIHLAKQAVADGAELIILDDGFQYRKLHRDFDLVLLDAADPYGKGHYLPWGFLRDSPKRLAQADAIFLSGKHPDFPDAIVTQTIVKRILDLQENTIPQIHGWKIGLFCGIAKPEKFKKTVIGLGADVVAEWILADHEPADIDRINHFAEKCKSLGAKALICTEKDFIKFSPGISPFLPVLFLEIESEIADGWMQWEKLIEKIDQKIDNSSTL